MDTQTAGHSDQGRRKNNEDFIAYFEPTDPIELKNYGSLYVVADGVGGAAKGERASQYAAQKAVFDYYQPYQPDPDTLDQSVLIEPLGYLRSILKQINEEIYEYATRHDIRMATTIVAAIVREGFLYVANVGDSRAYLIRSDIATQVNRDHSFVGEMVDHGEMTEAEAMTSSIKNKLTRSLGGDPDVLVETYEPLRLQSGDKILLCSDGLTRYALKEDVASMMTSGTPDEIATRFVQYANNKGGADNVSVIVISYQPSQMPESLTIPIIRPKDVDLETLQPTLLSHEINRGNKSRKREVDFLPLLLTKRKWQAAVVMILSVVVLVLAVAAGMAVFSGTAEILATTPAVAVTLPFAAEPQVAAPVVAATLAEPPLPTLIFTNAPTAINVNPSLILVTNSCHKELQLFKEPNADHWLAVLPSDTNFNVLPEGVQKFNGDIWLKTINPLNRDSNESAWLLDAPTCFGFSQGSNSVEFNRDTLQFGISTPIPTITTDPAPTKPQN